MACALGFDRTPEIVTRLSGGMEGETYALRLDGSALVVKVYVKNPQEAKQEFDNLTVVSASNVPTPAPILLESEGEWFGFPALVMTLLPGRPDMHPTDLDLWIQGAATALARIHEIPSEDAIAVRPPRWQRWQPSTEGMGSDAPRVDQVLAEIFETAAEVPGVFSHDDFNPGNLLFDDDGILTGVVDWADVTVEPRQADVALYRHFLAINPGGDAPDRFLRYYEKSAGVRLDDLPMWDVFYGLRGVRPVDHWVKACEALGLVITSEEIQSRSREWVRRGLRDGITTDNAE
jgi:aminoglycoside phosphotransferase (APT) family kinase protein